MQKEIGETPVLTRLLHANFVGNVSGILKSAKVVTDEDRCWKVKGFLNNRIHDNLAAVLSAILLRQQILHRVLLFLQFLQRRFELRLPECVELQPLDDVPLAAVGGRAGVAEH